MSLRQGHAYEPLHVKARAKQDEHTGNMTVTLSDSSKDLSLVVHQKITVFARRFESNVCVWIHYTELLTNLIYCTELRLPHLSYM